MIDSSVWIDYFNGVESRETNLLDDILGQRDVALGDLILTEVLQGFRHDQDFDTAKSLLDQVMLFELLGKPMALKAAHHFRALRKQGITIRKTADVIIATFCIDRDMPLLFSDRDFQPFVEHRGLKAA